MNFRAIIVPVCLLAGLTGCANMFHGSTEKLTVQTATPDHVLFAGAQCQLSNKSGSWLVTTPGDVTVHRGSEALQVDCIKDGYEQTILPSPSSPYVGEIFLGGGIGAIVDTTSGAAWGYQNVITVIMKPVATPAVASPTS